MLNLHKEKPRLDDPNAGFNGAMHRTAASRFTWRYDRYTVNEERWTLHFAAFFCV